MANDEFDWANFNKARQPISTTISTNLWNRAKHNQISWSDALEFGIAFKLAEKDEIDFPENSLSKKISVLTKLLNEKSDETERLKNDIRLFDAEKKTDEDLKKMGVFKDD